MPGNGAKRKAEPRKVKAAGKQKQAKKGKQWTKAQLDAQRVAKEKQEEEPPEDNTKDSAIALNSSDEEVTAADDDDDEALRRWISDPRGFLIHSHAAAEVRLGGGCKRAVHVLVQMRQLDFFGSVEFHRHSRGIRVVVLQAG